MMADKSYSSNLDEQKLLYNVTKNVFDKQWVDNRLKMVDSIINMTDS